jgi:hypothetical protein
MRLLSLIAALFLSFPVISLAQKKPDDATAAISPKSQTIVLAELYNGSFVPVTIPNYRHGNPLPPYLSSSIFANNPNSSYINDDPQQIRRLWTIRKTPSGARYGGIIGGIIGGCLGGIVGYDAYLHANIAYQSQEIIAKYAAAGIISGAIWGTVFGHIAFSGGLEWKPIWPDAKGY